MFFREKYLARNTTSSQSKRSCAAKYTWRTCLPVRKHFNVPHNRRRYKIKKCKIRNNAFLLQFSQRQMHFRSEENGGSVCLLGIVVVLLLPPGPPRLRRALELAGRLRPAHLASLPLIIPFAKNEVYRFLANAFLILRQIIMSVKFRQILCRKTEVILAETF